MHGSAAATGSNTKSVGNGVDPWARALSILQKLKPGQWLKIRDAAKHKPEFFKEIVKQLIKAGWSEYEFNEDYTEIRRIDLPDYARGWFSRQRMAEQALRGKQST